MVRGKLDIYNRFAVDQSLIGDKGAHGGFADFVLVVVRETERECGQDLEFFAVELAETRADFIDQRRVFCRA